VKGHDHSALTPETWHLTPLPFAFYSLNIAQLPTKLKISFQAADEHSGGNYAYSDRRAVSVE